MHLAHKALMVTILCGSSAGYAFQTPAAAPSDLLKPSLDVLAQTVGALKLDKWKGGTVRSEATSNIGSIQRDLQTTLPDLLTEVDQARGTMSKSLPVSRNLDALYAVVLRIFDGARIAGPGDQVDQLQQAMAGLDKARRAWNDRLQEAAAAQEKQISDLHMELKAQATPVCPTVSAAAPVVVVPKKKVVKKKAKPAVVAPPAKPQTSGATPNGAAKPN